MPYTIEMRDDKHCVVKINPDNTTETITCHDTHEQAVAHVQALEANVPDAKHKPIKHIGDSVKALADNRVGGYLVRFTDDENLDLSGEYFNANTDFWLERGYPVKGAPILIEHGFDDAFKVMPVGILEFVDERDAGLWVEGKLHDRQAYEEMLRKMRNKKQIDWTDERISKQAQLIESTVKAFFATDKVQWSSGALPQSVEVDNGHITSWAIIEGTGTISPAEPNGTEIALLKSAFKELQRSLSIQSDEPVDGRKDATEHKGATNTGGAVVEPDAKQAIKADTDKQQANNEGQNKMSKDDMLALLSQLAEAITEFGMESGASEDDAMAMTEEVMDKMDELDEEEVKSITPQAIAEKAFALLKAKIDEQKRDAKSARDAFNAAATDWKKSQPAKSDLPNYSNGGSNADAPAPRKSSRISDMEIREYAGMSADEMLLGLKLAVSRYPEYARKGLKLQDLVDNGVFEESYVKAAMHKLGASIEAWQAPPQWDTPALNDYAAVKSHRWLKADELLATDITNQGAELVEFLYDTQLWRRVRDRTELFNLMANKGMRVRDIPTGAKGMNVKYDTAGATVYTLNEANSVDATNNPESVVNYSQLTTAERDVPLGTHIIAEGVTFQLAQRSIIDIVREVQYDMEVALAESLESAMINGDTATTANTNINLIDGTPGTGIQKPDYLIWDGIRKNALAQAATYTDNAGAALDAVDYEEVRALFPLRFRTRKNEMLFIIDASIETRTRRLPEFLTEGVAGTRATIFTGDLSVLVGYDVYASGFLALSNGDGKIPTAGGTLGQIAAVYAPYWQYGRQLQITFEEERKPTSQTSVFVATANHAFAKRSQYASVMMYDIAVS